MLTPPPDRLHRKRPKGFLARYGSKLAVVGMLMLLGVVAWQHSHRRKLHEHLKLKDEHIQFMAATADQAQRDLHETTQTATTKTAEVDYLRKTVDRLRAELTAQVTKCVADGTRGREGACIGPLRLLGWRYAGTAFWYPR